MFCIKCKISHLNKDDDYSYLHVYNIREQLEQAWGKGFILFCYKISDILLLFAYSLIVVLHSLKCK